MPLSDVGAVGPANGRHPSCHECPNTVCEGVEKLDHAGPGRRDDIKRHEEPGMRRQGGDDPLVLTVKWMELVRLDG